MSGRSAKASRQQNAAAKESPASGRWQFAKTLVRVLGVQVITLVLLWLLQSTFSH
jgi:hypothetical protein